MMGKVKRCKNPSETYEGVHALLEVAKFCGSEKWVLTKYCSVKKSSTELPLTLVAASFQRLETP